MKDDADLTLLIHVEGHCSWHGHLTEKELVKKPDNSMECLYCILKQQGKLKLTSKLNGAVAPLAWRELVRSGGSGIRRK